MTPRDDIPTPWWWLSFCDPDRPKGTQFLGVAIIQGYDIIEASQRAWALGCNPGGEVMGLDITRGIHTIPPKDRGRLLDKDEIEPYGERMFP